MRGACATDPELVRALFRHLDAARVRYLVLRNHQGYPRALLKPDIGLLIAPDHAGLLVEAVDGACRERDCDWSLRAGARNNVVLDIVDRGGERLKIDARTYESIRLTAAHRLVPGLSYKLFWDDVCRRRVERPDCGFNAYGQPDELILLLNQWRRKRDPRYQRELAEALHAPEAARWFERATGVSAAAFEASSGFQAWHEDALRRLVTARWGPESLRRVVTTHARALRLLLGRMRPVLPPLVYLSGPDGAGKTALAGALDEVLATRKLSCRRLYSLRWLLRGAARRALRQALHARGAPPERFEPAWQRIEKGLLPPGAPGRDALLTAKLLLDVLDAAIGGALAGSLRLAGHVVVVETSPYDVFVKYGMPERPRLERLLAPLLPRPTLLLVLRASPDAIVARKPELTAAEVADYYRRLERVVDRAGVGARVREVDTGGPPEEAVLAVRRQVIPALAAARRRALPPSLPWALATTACPPALREALHADEQDLELLKAVPGRTVVRVRRRRAPPVIVKWWARLDLVGALRARTRTASWDHEWRSLRALHQAGVPVPRPVSLLQVDEAGVPVHAVLMEDLGRCTVALDHVKALAAAGDEEALRTFDAALIDLTARIVEAGFVDPDHRLNNVVVDATGRPLRLDVELARPASSLLSPVAHGRMLGCLVATYVYAVQPEVRLAERFAADLTRRLEPSWASRRAAARVVRGMLAVQRDGRGIDTRVELPW